MGTSRAEQDKKTVTRRVWITWGILTLAIVAWWFGVAKDGAFDCGLAADMIAHVEGGDVTRVTLAGREVDFNEGLAQGVNNVLIQVPEISDGYFRCAWGGSQVLGVFFVGLFAWPSLAAIVASLVWRSHPSYSSWKAEQAP